MGPSVIEKMNQVNNAATHMWQRLEPLAMYALLFQRLNHGLYMRFLRAAFCDQNVSK